MKHLTVIVTAFSLLAMYATPCSGGLINGDAEASDLTGWVGSPPVANVPSQDQFTGTVLPFEGNRFFSFAAIASSGGSLSQSGTIAGSETVLRLTGAYQTEFSDVAEAVITLLDVGNSQVAQQSTGSITTSDLQWQTFSIDVAVPPSASSWKVELLGTLTAGTFTNVFFDDLSLITASELPGDLNLDGLINAIDAGIMFANWGQVGLGYFDGNIVTGGLDAIDAGDAGIMFANWTGDAGPLATTIPEPSSLLMASLVGLICCRRRRR